jgi:hypothetical protein
MSIDVKDVVCRVVVVDNGDRELTRPVVRDSYEVPTINITANAHINSHLTYGKSNAHSKPHDMA